MTLNDARSTLEEARTYRIRASLGRDEPYRPSIHPGRTAKLGKPVEALTDLIAEVTYQ